jgi:hypothetical protein
VSRWRIIGAVTLAVAGVASAGLAVGSGEPATHVAKVAAAEQAGCTAEPLPPSVYVPARGFVRERGGRFTTIRPPGACTGKAFGINNRGEFVGGYRVGGYLVGEGSVRSYLWRRGRLIGIRPPGGDRPGVEVSVGDINDRGQMVGSSVDTADGTFDGFLRDPNGKITPIRHPDADGTSPVGSGTLVGQITNRGEIVGAYIAGGTIHGFVRDRTGRYSTIDRPGTAATALFGINDQGKIVGASSNSGPADLPTAPQSFLLDHGRYTGINVPDSAATGAQSINSRHEIVGTYLDANGILHGYLRDRRGGYTTVDHPDAMNGSSLTDINDRGQITGLVEFRPDQPSGRRQPTLLGRRQRPILLPAAQPLVPGG